MKCINLTFTLSILSSLVSRVVSTTIQLPVRVPGADTPLFYLISSSQNSQSNLLPLRLSGGTNNYTALTGSGSIGMFRFSQGDFVGVDASDPSLPLPALIAATSLMPVNPGCTTYGQLDFTRHTTDKCALRETFGIQSNAKDPKLGAKLEFNSVGGFYACGTGLDVWYKVAPEDGPTGCSRIDLYTVPVV